jgi:hypothetical protein
MSRESFKEQYPDAEESDFDQLGAGATSGTTTTAAGIRPIPSG